MICPGCGREVDQRYRDCVYCGRQLDAASPYPPAPGAGGQVPQQGAQQPAAPYPPVAAGQPVQQYPRQQYPPQAYGQPTVQMPAQGYAGQPYQQPPPYAYPQAQYPAAYPQQAVGRGSWVLGLIILLAACTVIGCTFLPWVTASSSGSTSAASYSGSASVTGWSLMTTGSPSGGFSMILTGEGAIFFTGFFSLLMGALVLLAAVVVFFRRKVGGWLALSFAVVATAVASINIAMVYAKMSPLSPHVGLWLFAGMSMVALVLSIVSLASG